MGKSKNQKNRQTFPRLGFGDFSHDELARIQAKLKRRFNHAGISQIGFGRAAADGKPDPARPFSACFFVINKRMPRDPSKRIPPLVSLRMKRGSRRTTIQIPTDVIRSGKMRPTGREVRRTGQAKRVTTGYAVSWKQSGSSGRRYAIVTVGHHFPSSLASDIVYLYRTSSSDISGQLLISSSADSQVDAAIVAFEHQDLLDADLIFSPAKSFKARNLETIKSDVQSRHTGISLVTKNRKVPFTFEHYFPVCDDVVDLHAIKHVVRVVSTATKPFRLGRSGTLFINHTQQATALQYAGVRNAYQVGYGQALFAILAWAEKELVAHFNMRPGTLRLENKF